MIKAILLWWLQYDLPKKSVQTNVLMIFYAALDALPFRYQQNINKKKKSEPQNQITASRKFVKLLIISFTSSS